MNMAWKVIVVAALAAAIVAVFALKQGRKQKADMPVAPVVTVATEISGTSAGPSVGAGDKSKPLPRLVDVGAGTCIPCKMMMPVLAELKTECAGRLRVEYCDIRDDPNAVQKYKIMVIPTQILYDASGKELFRHEGFFAKEDILAKWKEFGIDLTGPTSQASRQHEGATRTDPDGR